MNKLKGIILVVSICFASIMMPFNICAESIDSHIRGRNYSFQLNQSEKINTNNIYANSGVFHVTFELDDNYVGYILPNYTITYRNYYYGSSSPSWGTSTSGFNRRVFINGSSFSFDVPITWYSNGPFATNSGADPFEYDSYTISSSDVTKTSDINSIDQIITILTDLYNSQDQVEGLLNNQLTQLQQVVSNTNLSNQYLNTISKLKQWNIPLESYGYNIYQFQNNRPISSSYNINYFNYPIFDISNNYSFYVFWGNPNDVRKEYVFIQYIRNNIQGLDNLKTKVIPNDGEITRYETIQQFNDGGDWWSLVKFYVSNFSSTGIKYIKWVGGDTKMIFVYSNYSSFNYLNTDFALQYGLSNRLLDNIDKIANGTTASNSASQQLDSNTSDFVSDRDDLVNIEDNMGDNMDSAMNQITPNNNGLSGFGGNFLTSAVWVRTQFERLTNNTPYGSLIVYGMTLGLALLLLGKVML